ncbi:MAG: V-type ATP synthase subunit D [Candidatus Bipolaricaulota bacterium]|nr:V-type ATP synthase subunit D [Candidatus Bipolaricaulota bacterium]MDW8110479.1 V-type ATP synthase subunit D [Candidatus Bipolaricaulota bacterium]MDW8329160.1 V-type ATP synthase subunit D [Candidatus Bipolaricaulota bacterium]
MAVAQRVNATRMELLKQKKRLAMAKRGHKLLKQKRDELMHRFLELVEETRGLRERVEEKLARGFRSFLLARAEMSKEFMEEALMTGASSNGALRLRTESVMSVWVPRFDYSDRRDIYAYGFAATSAELDTALTIFQEVLPEMIKLAEIEKSLELLAEEIETTRRRVNALERVLIPQIDENIKRISMALDEMERSSRASLMRIKEIIHGEV